jgi:hypothetical protein
MSMNVLHSSMEITDEVYRQFGDEEIKKIIGLSRITVVECQSKCKEETLALFEQFLEWMKFQNNK